MKSKHPVAGHLNTHYVTADGLPDRVSSMVGDLLRQHFGKSHGGHMDVDDFDGLELSVGFRRDMSGNGYGLIITVVE